MRLRPLFVLAPAGLCAAGAAALMMRKSEHSVSMHPDDWRSPDDGNAHRTYRSAGHALHHLKEAAGLAAPTAAVYLRQAISPAFREQIMITTAVSNNCPI